MLKMAEDPDNFFYFSPEHVVDYCRFAERLKHFEDGSWQFNQFKANGEPDDSIILEPWQIWIEAAIQGFRLRNGQRLVSTVLEMAPRKSAKSLKACIATLFDLCCGGMSAEIPIAAASEKQAEDTVYGDILKMVNNDEELVKHFDLKVTKKEITRGTGRIFMLTSMGERQDGLNPSLALFEEGHGGAHSVYRVIESAFGARPNALKRMITTAGYRLEGIAFDLMADAKMILEGRAEDWSFFAAIYTLDKEDYLNPETNVIDYERLFTDEDLLYKANPMMDISLDAFKIQGMLKTALRGTPSQKIEQARTRFNIWTGAGNSLIEPMAWAACQRKIRLEHYRGRKCWIGVDLAQVRDMCSIGLIFEEPDGSLAVFCRFYLPELSPTMTNPEVGEYLTMWAEQEYLTITEGPLADHDMVRDDVLAYCEFFDVQMIACDPAQAHNTVKHLWNLNQPVMTYPNSQHTMTAPFDDFDGRIVNQTIKHDGNPVLAWNVSNVHGDRKGNGLILPRKEKDYSPRKIDGFVALMFANGVRLNPELAKKAEEDLGPTGEDPYETRGLIGHGEA